MEDGGRSLGPGGSVKQGLVEDRIIEKAKKADVGGKKEG